MEKKKCQECQKENINEFNNPTHRLSIPDKRLAFHQHDQRHVDRNFKELCEQEIDNIINEHRQPEAKSTSNDAVYQHPKGAISKSNAYYQTQIQCNCQKEGVHKPDEHKIEYRKPKLTRRRESETLTCDIYNEEYLDDIYANLREVEKRTILPINYLRLQKNCHKMRATTVNWLLFAQDSLKLSQAELYLSINFMDQMLARSNFSTRHCGILLLSSVWIVSKLIGTSHISAEQLCHISQTYTPKQLITTEAYMLKMLDFKIHSYEPSVFLNYFLYSLGSHKSHMIKQYCYYILDCFSLCQEFSVYPASIIAAAVVKIACCTSDSTLGSKLDKFFTKYMSAEDMWAKKQVENIILWQLEQVTMETYPFKKTFKKKYPSYLIKF